MTHILTILIGCFIILFTRKLYHRNFELFLCILIPVNFHYFHLVPRLSQFDIFRESLLVVVLFYFFEEYFVRVFLQKNRKEKVKLGKYGKFITGYLCLVCFGFIVSLYQGQEVWLGLKAMKYYPLLLTFFLVLKREVNIEKFFNYFIWMATIIAVLAALQYVTYEKITLFYFYEDSIDHLRGFNSIRGMRILEGTTVITIGVIAAFASWIKRRKKISLLLALFLFVEIWLVIKTRAVLAGIILTMIITSFIYNRKKMNNIARVCYFAGSLICIGVITVSYSQSYWKTNALVAQTISDFQSVGSRVGTPNLNIRLQCYEYYWKELQPLWLTGRGVLNFNWPGNSDSYAQKYLNLHISDIGVFHMLFNFGIIGGLFVLLLLGNIAKDIPFSISTPQVASYFIIGIILLPQIDMFFHLDHIFLFSIFLAFFAQEKTPIINSSKFINASSALKPMKIH